MNVLCAARDVLPWKGVVRLTDAQGEEAYTASSRPRFPKAVWTLIRGQEPVGSFHCEALALLHTCHAAMGEDRFVLRNRAALRRHIDVEGGPFDGAVLSGSLLDGEFRLEHQGRLIAEADAKLFSMREAHTVRLMTDDPDAERFTALMVVNLLIQKYEES